MEWSKYIQIEQPEQPRTLQCSSSCVVVPLDHNILKHMKTYQMSKHKTIQLTIKHVLNETTSLREPQTQSTSHGMCRGAARALNSTRGKCPKLSRSSFAAFKDRANLHQGTEGWEASGRDFRTKQMKKWLTKKVKALSGCLAPKGCLSSSNKQPVTSRFLAAPGEVLLSRRIFFERLNATSQSTQERMTRGAQLGNLRRGVERRKENSKEEGQGIPSVTMDFYGVFWVCQVFWYSQNDMFWSFLWQREAIWRESRTT